tara:strand:+ start:1887 stop:3485 length:1599 start_codon:yes stop_codon:yes gene_type:complete
MRIFTRLFLKYIPLIVFAFLFEIFFNKINTFIFLNLFENLFFAFASVFPLYFLNNLKYKRYCFYLTYIFFSISLFLETAYYYLFKTFFSSSAIFVALDSNTDESKEFLSFYLDAPVILCAIVFFVLTVFILFKSKKYYEEISHYSKASKLKMVFLFLGIIIFVRQSTLIRFNLPYLILKSGLEYYSDSKVLGDNKNNKKGNFIGVSRLSNNDEDETYVVIIGESTARSHMGIYGYYRETTPSLSGKKDQFLIYKDVVSPHAYSVGSLLKILTLGNYETPERMFEGSIIQLINSAGFETYWLSNQRPIGPYESLITKISLSSKNHMFLSTAIAGNSTDLDEELLNEYSKIINNDVKKKVVFVHMMGTHHHYENRYPEAFNKFKDEPRTNFKSKESFEKINHYDNAVLYNDFVISEAISKLDSLKTKSFALYFSDHAEEMYSDLDMAGHNEDIYSQEMFDIPFFLWQSQKFEQSRKLHFVEDRKYMIDDLFHSLADLLDISAKEVDSTRSIFNENFVERKRIIKDTINYDVFFD